MMYKQKGKKFFGLVHYKIPLAIGEWACGHFNPRMTFIELVTIHISLLCIYRGNITGV